MGLTRQSVQQTADALVRDGMVALVHNPADRGARLMTLTEAGRSALRYVETRQAGWASAIGCHTRTRGPHSRYCAISATCYPVETQGDSAPSSSSPLSLSRKDIRNPSAALSTHT